MKFDEEYYQKYIVDLEHELRKMSVYAYSVTLVLVLLAIGLAGAVVYFETVA